MRRIYEPPAYSGRPIERCFWAQDQALPGGPPLTGPQRADVAVIGAGYTGLSAALHLAEAGADVAVIEAESPFWGASGRNGGFCCLGGAMASDAALTRRFGADGRRAWRDTEKAAIALVADLLERHAIDADTHSRGETILAHRPSAMKALRAEADGIAADYGVDPVLTEARDLPALGMSGPFHGALTIPLGFALHPRKYAAGLARAATDAGARIFCHSPVTRIAQDGGYVLHTPLGTLQARRLILATNGYSSEDVPPWMRARYMPLQSSIIVTRPLSAAEQAAQGWTSAQMAYDTRKLLHYFRLMPDGRFLFGMRGGVHATPRHDAALKARILADFRAMFPAWADVDIPHHWSGLVCLSRHLLPYAGPIPGMKGAFAGFGWHGNGVAMGSHAGRVLAALALGRTPPDWPAALRKVPPRFPLGRFRRFLLTLANAAYALRDG